MCTSCLSKYKGAGPRWRILFPSQALQAPSILAALSHPSQRLDLPDSVSFYPGWHAPHCIDFPLGLSDQCPPSFTYSALLLSKLWCSLPSASPPTKVFEEGQRSPSVGSFILVILLWVHQTRRNSLTFPHAVILKEGKLRLIGCETLPHFDFRSQRTG